jgi:hypothetical protein
MTFEQSFISLIHLIRELVELLIEMLDQLFMSGAPLDISGAIDFGTRDPGEESRKSK